MSGGKIGTQVLSGLKLTAKLLFGFITAAMFWDSIAWVSSTFEAAPGSLLARFPELPWICLLTSTIILIVTMNSWVTIIPGLMAYSTLGGLIMLFEGHYNNLVVPRPVALILTLFTVVTAALASTFRRRKLNLIDRIALMGFVTCLAIGTTKNISRMFWALGFGFGFLLLAWCFDVLAKRSQEH